MTLAGATGATGTCLSSYIEAVGKAQSVPINSNFVFDTDPDALDIAGNDITINDEGTIFTINKAGLYSIEWDMNLSSVNPPALIGLMENNAPASVLANVNSTGNYSSGALINVTEDDLPYIISLHNLGNDLSIADHNMFQNTALAIRIFRFADGAE